MNRLLTSLIAALLISACGGATTQTPPAAAPETQQAASLAWQTFSPEGEGFSIEMPGEVGMTERSTPNGRVPVAFTAVNGQNYMVFWNDNTVGTVAATDRDTLYRDAIQNGATSGSCIIGEMTRVQWGGHEGRDALLRCAQAMMRMRFVFVGNRIFGSSVIGPRESMANETATRFFESLRITTLPFAPAASPWQTVSQDVDHVRFDMPAGDIHITDLGPDENVEDKYWWYIGSNEGRFEVHTERYQYAHVDEQSPIQAAQSICDDVFAWLSEQAGSVTRAESVDGWPALNMTRPKENGFIGLERWVCVNDSAYALTAIVLTDQQSSEVVTHFHQSFHADAPVAPRNARRGANGRRR